MNKAESKYFNTALRMDEAFLELLSQKDFAYITVKEICEKAAVNRSTFYLHYETVADLLCESIEYMNERFLNTMELDSRKIVGRLKECAMDELYFVTPEYLTPYLNNIKENRRLFRTAIENPGTLRLRETYDKMFASVFTPILERFQVPAQYRKYMMEFYIHGLIAIITEWVKGDCADPIENIIAVIRHCVIQIA